MAGGSPLAARRVRTGMNLSPATEMLLAGA